jgi:hypothetical protein
MEPINLIYETKLIVEKRRGRPKMHINDDAKKAYIQNYNNTYYSLKRKDKRLETNEYITCECGKSIFNKSMKKHLLSMLHQNTIRIQTQKKELKLIL